MANLTPLRNIHLSGGLFTENLLLKIRDKKDQIPEVQWTTFGEKWREEKKQYYEVWDWAKRLFGEIADNLDSWTIENRYEKWIKPLLQKLGHESKPKLSIDLTTLSEEELDNILNRIQITHTIKNHAKIGLHICEDDNFDERNDTNYQKKSQHDHFQRFILLNEGVRWGILSNGKHIRLLGEYSNIYAKGYIQFNLDSIFINKDESEFWVFYALIHHSHFNETYGLNPDDWINKLKKKWIDLSKKLSFEDADINLNIISEGILNVYNKILNEFIDKANNKGVMSIKSSDSEIFMQNIKDRDLVLGEIGRDFCLKELDSIISDINENLSIIQRLQKRSQEEGIEAGKKLRENVKKALELMGEGLINSSKPFTDDILKGNIEIKDFYQELLRITYRIIFILYAEAKDLLPGAATIYYNDLGLTFLRKKAQQPIREDQNTDLWYRLLLLFKYLDIGESSLGINAFSGELFNPKRIPLILDESYKLFLPNSGLLKFIRELTIVDLGIGLQPIDYTEIGEEEIGGIYEALLDFQPKYIRMDTPTYHFILEEIDTERKGSGTYYTPKGLIDILLKTALKPVIEKKLMGLNSKEDKLNALLDLKICDPACGGGSFLLVALDYLGKIFAQIDSEQEFPDDESLRKSRRVILQNCIYGVDLNPLALELAKVSLWVKASVKDKPLTFLNNHLKLGNSLIGFTKRQKIGKIPSIAFNKVGGNTKTGIPNESNKALNEVRKRLKNFTVSFDSTSGKTSIQQTILPYKDSERYSTIANNVFEMEENNIIQLQNKIKCYSELLKSNSWKNLNNQANLWTSCFFWDLSDNYVEESPTDSLITEAKKGTLTETDEYLIETHRLKNNYSFFNWYLEFPEVFPKKNPGFDCILMNPPWEVLLLHEMEFFSGKSEDVLNTKNKKERVAQIKKLMEKNSKLFEEYIQEFRKIKKLTHYLKSSGFYDLSTKGSINLFAVFIERTINLINKNGKVGTIVPSILFTGKNLSQLFNFLVDKNSLENSYIFINEKKIFPSVHHSFQFCLLTFSYPKEISNKMRLAFSIWDINEFEVILENFDNNLEYDENLFKMKEGGAILEFEKKDFELFNPNTKTSPSFKRKKDFLLVKKVYEKCPILIKRYESGEINNAWKIKFKEILHNQGDSDYFLTKDQLRDLKASPLNEFYDGGIWITQNDKKFYPIYTGSAIWSYDHRYNEVVFKDDQTKKAKSDQTRVTTEKHQDPYFVHTPLYYLEDDIFTKKYPKKWNKDWFICFRKITNAIGMRTLILSVIPNYPFVDSLTGILFNQFTKKILCFIANLSCIPLDYVVRNKISAINIAHYNVEQFPIFPPNVYSETHYNEIKSRVIELIYTSFDIKDFISDFDIVDKPFEWNDEKRLRLKSEIDAIYSLMFGFNRSELEYILDTFFVMRNSDQKEFGEFKTKRLILEAYDKFNSDPKLGPLFRLEGVHLDKIKGE